MADNGKIIRNGAEIQIDENGNVIARPADGQEFIVEDDARVGTLEADETNIGGFIRTVKSDEKLDAALSIASDGDGFLLSNEQSFSKSRTGDDSINMELSVTGVGAPSRSSATRITSDWEFAETCLISNIGIGNNTITVSGRASQISDFGLIGSLGELVLNADRITVSNVTGSSAITFESGTSDGEIGVVTGNVSVTDNGDNRIL